MVRDPYARWCGRGGIARCPPIPINPQGWAAGCSRSRRTRPCSAAKIDIDEFPNVKRWLEEIGERPAVKKAMAMGPEFREDLASISAEEQARRRKLVADQRAQPIPSEWVRAA